MSISKRQADRNHELKAKKNKKKRKKDNAERNLESFLFGGDVEEHTDLSALGNEMTVGQDQMERSTTQAGTYSSNLVIGSTSISAKDLKGKTLESSDTTALAEHVAADEAPAWVDEDDEAVRVNISNVNRLRKLRNEEDEEVIAGTEYTARLRKQFNKVNPAVDWAHMDVKQDQKEQELGVDEDGVPSASALLRSTQRLTASSKLLPANKLQVTRMKDANVAERSQAVISDMGFHKNGHVFFTAGLDKTVRLFQIDGVRNPKVQSVFFADLPIRCAKFTADGTELIVSGRRKHFYSYDLLASKILKIPGITGRKEKSLEKFTVSPTGEFIAFHGNDGNIIVVHGKTKQWVANLKMNGSVDSCSFSGDGSQLYSTGGDGQVYIWDVKQRRCINRFVDDGTIHGTCVSLSRDGRYCATGSDSGVVNLYSTTSLIPEQSESSSLSAALKMHVPQPSKSLMNITTSIDHLAFTADGQLLAMASSRKKEQLRMVHVQSGTVFSNWPTASTPLHYVNSMAFSPNGGYFAIGNDKGRALLYRLTYYQSA